MSDIDWADEEQRQAAIDAIVVKRLAKQKRSILGEIETELGGSITDLRAKAARADEATAQLEEIQRKIEGKELDELQQLQRTHERAAATLSAERDSYKSNWEQSRQARQAEQMRLQLSRAARAAGAGPAQIEDAALLLQASGLFEAETDDTGRISVMPRDATQSLDQAVTAFLTPKAHLLDPGPQGSGARGAPPPKDAPPKDPMAEAAPGAAQFALGLQDEARRGG